MRWTLFLRERSLLWGKKLKGKECGKGIFQRKDSLYFARFYAKNGTRQNRNFKTLPEASGSTFSLCDEAGIKRFYMHSLRHTYATRAIERGVQPKVLQQLSGHASIKTTMDRYVHVTDESLVNAIRQFQQATPPVKQKGRKKGVQEI